MIARSNRAEVRNPLSTLPACERIRELDATSRQVLQEILRDLARDARARADKSWRTHKAPMALYWKMVAVYARHLARLIATVEELK